MPVKPENRARYPANWSTEVRPAILARASNCCEGSPAYPDCRAPNGAMRNNKTDEVTTDHEVIQDWAWLGNSSMTKIVLTVAHLDHQPENCNPDNLRAWCQRCHLAYDRIHHAETRRATIAARNPSGTLFQEKH